MGIDINAIKGRLNKLQNTQKKSDSLLENQTEITDLYSELSYDELKDVLEGWLNPTAESTNEPASESTTLSESKKEVKNDLPFDVDESKPTPSKKTDDVASAFDDLFNN